MNGNISVVANGAVSGGINGISSSANGSGSIVIGGMSNVSGFVGAGISARANGGNVTVIPSGNVSGTTGISASTNKNGNLVVTAAGSTRGTVLTGVSTSSANGTTIINGSGNVYGLLKGVSAESSGTGDITINGTGNVNSSLLGTGINVEGHGGNISVAQTGNISAGTGIRASTTLNGTVSVDIINNISASTEDGVDAYSVNGTLVVNGAGNISAYENGIYARSNGTGAITINGSGTIHTVSGAGIMAMANGGNILVNQTNNISAAVGISASTTQNGTILITVINGTTITANGSWDLDHDDYAAGDGIDAVSVDGNVSVVHNGVINATATGISTASKNGTIIINGTANVTGGTNGISANSTGTGTVTINGTGNITGTGGTGILATANGGDISIAQNGNITGLTGISASTTGTGNISIGVSSGSVLTATSANGVNANGVDGLVGVTNNGSIVAVGTGISATSNNGTLTIVNNGEISGYAGSIDTGIYALASGSGSISVTSLANITAANYGINATSGSGAINVTIDPGITVTNNGAFGVKAVSNDDGNIFVKINGSNSFINASGNNSYGVYATTNGSNSTGNVIVSVLNGASISNSGTNGTAVYAVSSTNVTVNVLGNSSIQASGSNATAVYAYANGNVIINVDAGSSITAPSGSSYALQIANGTTTIYNLGVITGGLSLFGTNNAMTSSGLWIVYDGNGSSSIGAKYITNNGTLQTFMSVEGPPPTRIRYPLSGVRSPVGNPPSGAVTVTLNTTSDFNNNGLITMQDPNAVAGDQVLMPNANFTGGGASTLAVDSELGAPGSISDTLHIANAAGSTTINVVDAAPSTPGAYNPTGILVVDVTGNATPSNFNLQNGPINKGLFSYDLIFRPANGAQSDNQFLLVGSPGRSAFELSALSTAVQTEWYDTSEILLQRQEELRSQFMENNPVKNSASLSDIVRARQVGGVWAKLLGAAADRDQTQTYSIFNKSYNYNTGYRLQKGGIIGGVDGESIGTSGSSSALLFGLFGGTVSSSMHFKSSATRADFEGGTAGAYATYIKGNMFIDGLLRMDFQRLHYNAPSLTGWGNTDPSTPVFSLGGIVNAGYRMNFASTRYVEAFASLADVDTRIDPMTVSASTVSFGTQSNVSGRLGLRLGATFMPEDGTRIETFLAGGAWQRLSGANFVTINSDPSAPVLTIADKKVPTYGELSTGINIFGLNTGWSGFLKTNYKFSIGFNSGAINGGLAYKW